VFVGDVVIVVVPAGDGDDDGTSARLSTFTINALDKGHTGEQPFLLYPVIQRTLMPPFP
jgi:hypothetical protein